MERIGHVTEFDEYFTVDEKCRKYSINAAKFHGPRRARAHNIIKDFEARTDLVRKSWTVIS